MPYCNQNNPSFGAIKWSKFYSALGRLLLLRSHRSSRVRCQAMTEPSRRLPLSTKIQVESSLAVMWLHCVMEYIARLPFKTSTMKSQLLLLVIRVTRRLCTSLAWRARLIGLLSALILLRLVLTLAWISLALEVDFKVKDFIFCNCYTAILTSTIRTFLWEYFWEEYGIFVYRPRVLSRQTSTVSF